jgi:predicted RND superfamily exporter protein
MTKQNCLITRFYDRIILERPLAVILCLLVVVFFLGYKTKDFRLDASAETLILESDEDLKYSRLIESRYGGHDYLLMTYTPKENLFSAETLITLTRLRDELEQLENVSSVLSILDAPLLESQSLPLKEWATDIQTLESPAVDRKRARIEFSSSPIYRNLLVSPDLKVSALQINFRADKVYQDLLTRYDHLMAKKSTASLTSTEIENLKKVTAALQKCRDKMKASRHLDITAIRAIMAKYRQDAELFLGGVSMIADDLIRFIKNDLKIFGLGVSFFMVATLSIIFRQKRWIFLPMLCCAFSAVSMMGILGTFGWQVTVISSNFISLQLIITMAIAIHLIVRYRELQRNNPETAPRKLILDTVRLMLTPCLYAALTTIAGFGSLLFCNILPVRTFGWMMSAGIMLSLVMTFLLLPAALVMLGKREAPDKPESHFSLAPALARFTVTNGIKILIISALTFMISVVGICKLDVENSFINYFKETTEIYQGMKVIDQNLGGTTPLDVIVEIDEPDTSEPVAAAKPDAQVDAEFDVFDEFDEAQDDKKYWFTYSKMALVVKIHDYLASLPETGKVLSLGTIIKIAKKLNNDRPLDNFQLAMFFSQMPDRFQNMLLKPFVSPEHNQLRFSIRVKDSEKTLQRNALLKKIRHNLTYNLGLEKEHVHLTGLLVLYNNMLQSLFQSQFLTLGVVIMALIFMLLILFKSLKIAFIAIAPNLLAIGVVLGFMGWLSIPLDMMTITIAAISIGIAVDNTIHYIYRFKHELEVDRDYISAIHRCHGSIGYALFYTCMTIMIGFSILALSNFIPSIYFGLLTGLAMLIALIATLTLLPQLLFIFKPFGSEIAEKPL